MTTKEQFQVFDSDTNVWIMKFEGEIFTIYDLKTYDAEYTKNELDTWSIGGNANSAALLFAFKNYIHEL